MSSCAPGGCRLAGTHRKCLLVRQRIGLSWRARGAPAAACARPRVASIRTLHTPENFRDLVSCVRRVAAGNDSYVVPLRVFVDASPAGRDVCVPAAACPALRTNSPARNLNDPSVVFSQPY